MSDDILRVVQTYRMTGAEAERLFGYGLYAPEVEIEIEMIPAAPSEKYVAIHYPSNTPLKHGTIVARNIEAIA